MFHKINFDFLKPNIDWINLDRSLLVSEYDAVSTKLEYFKLDNFEKFKTQHLKRPYTIMPDSVLIGRITGKGLLLPHRDHDVGVVLNFYVSASDEHTVFYKEKPNARKITYPGKGTSNIFLPEDVEEVSRFTAEKNSAYLLNVSQIHSVIKTNPEPRIFINYGWKNATYEEVLESVLSVAKTQQAE